MTTDKIKEAVEQAEKLQGNYYGGGYGVKLNRLSNDQEFYKECTDWLVKIREDLSDVSFQPGTVEYAIASPEGIYEMVMELKGLLKETEQMLLATYKKKKELEEENHQIKEAYQDREDDIDYYVKVLREIDTHIRSSSSPVSHIIETLKATLPEYHYEFE